MLLGVASALIPLKIYAQASGAAPVIITTEGFTEFEPTKGAVIIDGGVTVTDSDSPFASKAIVKLTNLPDGGNELISIDPAVVQLANENKLVVNYNFTTGELTITGEASFAVYQQILQKLTYNNVSQVPDTADRLVNYTIFDQDGNASADQTRVVKIKNVQALVTSVSAPPNGLYGIEDEISIQLTFNRPVWVTEGSPRISLQLGDQQVYAAYSSGSGSSQLTFTYTVQEGDLDQDGLVFGNTIDLNTGLINDSTGEPANLLINNMPGTSQVHVDGIRPWASELTLPQAGQYAVCSNNVLTFTLTSSEPIRIEGEGLMLSLTFDSGERNADYDEEASDESHLVFTYSIASGDTDSDGITVNALVLGEAKVLDVAGNELTDISLSLTSKPDTNQILIDGTAVEAPVVTGISPDSGSSDSDGQTNNADFTINGTAGAGLEVKVILDDKQIGTAQASESGNWSYDASAVEITEGHHIISAVATEGDCNTSAAGDGYALLLDLNGPQLLVNMPTLLLDGSGQLIVKPEQIVQSVTDNYTATENIIISLAKDTFTCENIGENEVLITATDLAGNSTEVSAIVTIAYDGELDFELVDASIDLDETGAASFLWDQVVKGVTGTCQDLGSFSYSLSQSEFDCSHIGENAVLLTVTGEGDFSASYELTITVHDQLAPSLSSPQENVEVLVGISAEYAMEDYAAIFGLSDNCSVTEVSQSPAVGEMLYGYNIPHPVTISAKDASGNELEYSFSVTLITNVLVSIVDPEMLMVSWGTEEEELSLPEQVIGILASGEEVMVTVSWDMVNYESTVPGIYQNSGEIQIQDTAYTLAEEMESTLTLTVMEKLPPEDILLSDETFSVEDDPIAPLGVLSTVDPDDDQHSYALTGAYPDEVHFYILGDRLFWTAEDMPDDQYEFVIQVSSTDQVGNTITKDFMIERLKPSLDGLAISNVFSPNGDNINDTWGIEALRYYGEMKLMVFERGGKMVYVSFDPEDRWDGRYEGSELPVGSYYYVIELAEAGQKRRGVLTLLRD